MREADLRLVTCMLRREGSFPLCCQALKTSEDWIRESPAHEVEAPRRQDGLQAYLAAEARRRAGRRVGRSRSLLEVHLNCCQVSLHRELKRMWTTAGVIASPRAKWCLTKSLT